MLAEFVNAGSRVRVTEEDMEYILFEAARLPWKVYRK
jgi:hypothetical protein